MFTITEQEIKSLEEANGYLNQIGIVGQQNIFSMANACARLNGVIENMQKRINEQKNQENEILNKEK